MSTAIYDSSLLTQRRQAKAESGAFINRTRSANPQPGYGPALGIYDQSIINTVKDGNMKYFRKGTGGTTLVDNGCPCAPASNCSSN